MNAFVRAMCLAILFAATPFSATAEDFAEAIRAYLQQNVHAEIPNGCVVVGLLDEHGRKVVSCGTLDNGTDQEAGGDTVFGIHSMTGTFTYLVLQDMVERGKMKLEDPAAKYLPKSIKMPTYRGKEITLHHLAAESSGLPDLSDKVNPKHAENPLADFTVEKMDALVSGCQLACAPGTKHFHGGVDKGLLGQAIERTAESDFESLLVDRICRPLKMESTRFTLTSELKSRLASEHNQFGYAKRTLDMGALKPLNGLYSTANDLLTILAAFDLTPSSLTPFLEKHQACFSAREGGIFYTGGGGFGYRAIACYDKTRHRGVVILSTSADLTRNFADLLLESQWQSNRRPAQTKISSQAYGSYVGQYQCSPDAGQPRSSRPVDAPSGSVIGIRRDGDRLFVHVIGSSSAPLDALLPPITAELLPESETRFFERLSGQPVTFSRDAGGRVTDLTMNYRGKPISYNKISDLPPKAPEPVKLRRAIKLDIRLLDAVVGQYVLAPRDGAHAPGTLTIWREGDQLVAQPRSGTSTPGALDIYPESETSFFLKFDGSQLTFIKNNQGEVTAVIHHSSHAGVADCEGKKVK